MPCDGIVREFLTCPGTSPRIRQIAKKVRRSTPTPDVHLHRPIYSGSGLAQSDRNVFLIPSVDGCVREDASHTNGNSGCRDSNCYSLELCG